MREIKRYTENDCTYAILQDSEGNEYKLRVVEDNQHIEVYVGNDSLQKRMIGDWGYNPNFPTAEEVDDSIVYYVQDKDFDLSDEDLLYLLAKECPIVFGEDDED